MFILKGRAGILWEAIGCHEHNVKNLRGPEESKAKKKKKKEKPILLIWQLGWGLVSLLDIGVRTPLKAADFCFPPEFSLVWASTVSTAILPHVWEVGR